jgi:hypothetical protein
MPYRSYDRCPSTGFWVNKWIDTHGAPLVDAHGAPRFPTVDEVKARQAYPYYDTPEVCSITLEPFGPTNRPFIYVNDQSNVHGLHAYSHTPLMHWLARGNRCDPEARENWGSPYTGVLLPVMSAQESALLQHLHHTSPALQLQTPPHAQSLYALHHTLNAAAVHQLVEELNGRAPRVITAGLAPDAFSAIEAHVIEGEDIHRLTAELMGHAPLSGSTMDLTGQDIARIRGFLTGAIPLP